MLIEFGLGSFSEEIPKYFSQNRLIRLFFAEICLKESLKNTHFFSEFPIE